MRTVKVRRMCGVIEEWAVNKEYEGLFKRQPDGNWHQMVGCGQFKASTPAQLMAKMKKALFINYGTTDTNSMAMVRGSARGWEEDV